MIAITTSPVWTAVGWTFLHVVWLALSWACSPLRSVACCDGPGPFATERPSPA